MAAFGYSPALAAYMRAMNVEEQNVYAGAREQSDLAQRQYDRTVPQWEERTRAAGQDVLDSAESRGMYRSGITARDAARARTNVMAQQQEALAQAGDQQLAYGLDAARRVAELRRRAAEESLADRTAQAEAAARARYGG